MSFLKLISSTWSRRGVPLGKTSLFPRRIFHVTKEECGVSPSLVLSASQRVEVGIIFTERISDKNHCWVLRRETAQWLGIFSGAQRIQVKWIWDWLAKPALQHDIRIHCILWLNKIWILLNVSWIASSCFQEDDAVGRKSELWALASPTASADSDQLWHRDCRLMTVEIVVSFALPLPLKLANKIRYPAHPNLNISSTFFFVVFI